MYSIVLLSLILCSQANVLASCYCVITIIQMHYRDANKRYEEKVKWVVDENATLCFEQILYAIPHKTLAPLNSHLKTIKIKQTKYAGHCRICKDEFMSDVLPWTPTHRRVNIG